MTALGKLFRTTAFKLSAVYLVLFSIGAGLVLASVGRRVKTVLNEQIAETVDADLVALSEQYTLGGIQQLAGAVRRRAQAPNGSLYLVTTFAGDVIAGNIAEMPSVPPDERELVEATYRLRGETSASKHTALARIFLLPGGYQLLVGHDIQDHKILRGILRSALGASLFWLALVGALGGLFMAHRVLERVDAMSGAAARIMAGDLKQRLTVSDAGDELDRLAENLNLMLERIDELMQGLTQVSDNIAHDLKTPLTRLRNRAEEGLRVDGATETYRAALMKVIEESDALIRVFNALLLIARAEAGYSSDNIAPFDAAQVARDIAEIYEPLCEEQGVQLRLSAEGEILVSGQRDLFTQAVVNLVDNALKYGVATHDPTIEIGASVAGDRVEIVVADHGAGVSSQDRERIAGRFVRLENSRSQPGSGLGLSLAAAVARLHHGVLRIEDNGPGLRATLSLPIAASSAGPASRGMRENA